MVQNMVQKTIRVLEPVLIYYAAANMITMTMGLYLDDAAFLTGLTALLLLPLYLWMYRRDRARETDGGFGGTGKQSEAAENLSECQPKETVKREGTLAYLLAALLGILCNLALSPLISFLAKCLRFSNTRQDALLNGLRGGTGFAKLCLFLGVGIFAPMMEEVLFRGLVYRRLKGYTGNTQVSALASSALFAVWHGNAAQALFAFPMALLLTCLYERKGTLKLPIVFHQAVNISTILWTMGQYAGIISPGA